MIESTDRDDELPPLPEPMGRDAFLGRVDRAMLKTERILHKATDPRDVALVARAFGGLAATYASSAGFRSVQVDVSATAGPSLRVDQEAQMRLMDDPEYRALALKREELDQDLADFEESRGLPFIDPLMRAARNLEEFRRDQGERIRAFHASLSPDGPAPDGE